MGSPRKPQGQGFMAATSMKVGRIGHGGLAREMVTWPSSMGCRRTSRTFFLNSGSSSRKRTPLWARLTSPGLGFCPPPIRPASEMVWCGDRKGRLRDEPVPWRHESHDAVDLGGFEGLLKGQRGQNGGKSPCQHGLPRSGRPDHDHVVAAGGCDFKCPLGVFLAAHIAEIHAGRLPLEKTPDIHLKRFYARDPAQHLHQ